MRRAIVITAVSLAMVGVGQAEAAPAPAFRNQLTVYVIPAPRPATLSWRSPGALVRRVLINEAGKRLGFMSRTLGHMGVHVQCARGGEFKGSMTNSVDSEFQDTVLKQGYGLGVLFHNYSGRYERPEELQKSLDERYKNGRVTWVRFGISARTCQRLLAWSKAFAARGANKFYGLASRPRFAEGAGCSAFSMSFVDVGGLWESFMKPWEFDVRAPLKLIGGPLTGKKVSILRAAAYLRGWAKPNQPHKRITGWDPTQAFQAMKKLVRKLRRSQRRTLRRQRRALRRQRRALRRQRRRLRPSVQSSQPIVETRGRAFGLVLDRRNARTPTDPFFKK